MISIDLDGFKALLVTRIRHEEQRAEAAKLDRDKRSRQAHAHGLREALELFDAVMRSCPPVFAPSPAKSEPVQVRLSDDIIKEVDAAEAESRAARGRKADADAVRVFSGDPADPATDEDPPDDIPHEDSDGHGGFDG
jgi:hypothetical protein